MKPLAALAALLFLGAAPAVEADFVLSGTPVQGGFVRGFAPAGTHALFLNGAPVELAPDGGFVLGFGRDAVPAATLRAAAADGREIVRPLLVARRTWRLQRLPTLPLNRPRTPEAVARRDAELARIIAARSTLHPVEGWRQPFRWPATGRISGVFGSARTYAGREVGPFHSGADVAVPTGTPVLAPADGVVTLAASGFSVEGGLVIVDHGHRLSSAFLHLSRMAVAPGQTVRQGQPLGLSGATGRVTGPHLHWSVVWNGERIDPEAVLAAALQPTRNARTPARPPTLMK